LKRIFWLPHFFLIFCSDDVKIRLIIKTGVVMLGKYFFKSCHKSQTGFSLIEVMVAIAISMGLLYGVASMMIFNARAAKSAELTGDFNSLVSMTQAIINNETSCKAVFKDKSFTATVLGEIKPVISLGSLELNGIKFAEIDKPTTGLKVTKIEFDKIDNVLPDVTIAGVVNQQYMVNLHLETQKIMAGEMGAIGGSQKNANFKISVLVNANKITACYGGNSITESVSQTCTAMGGTLTAGVCTLPATITASAANRTCAAGNYVSGINTDGSVVCTALVGGTTTTTAAPTTTTTVATATTTTTTLPTSCPAANLSVTFRGCPYDSHAACDSLGITHQGSAAVPIGAIGDRFSVNCATVASGGSVISIAGSAAPVNTIAWAANTVEVAKCNTAGNWEGISHMCLGSQDCNAQASSVVSSGGGDQANTLNAAFIWSKSSLVPDAGNNTMRYYNCSAPTTAWTCPTGPCCQEMTTFKPSLPRQSVNTQRDVLCNAVDKPYSKDYGAQKVKWDCTPMTLDPKYGINGYWKAAEQNLYVNGAVFFPWGCLN
jgi:Tfp pilus assembly protein PilV